MGRIRYEKTGYRIVGYLLMCICALLLSLPLSVRTMAMEAGIDTQAAGTLTVSYTYGTDSDEKILLPGAVFHIYRIASYDANGVFSLTSEFAECGVTDEQLNSMEHAEDFSRLTETLVQYMETSGLNSETLQYQCAQTDQNGEAVFSELETGLYLLTVDDLTLDRSSYAGSPALVSIPSANKEGTAWEYEVSANVKPEATAVTEPGDEPEEPETPGKTTEDTEEEEPSSPDETDTETTNMTKTGDDSLPGVWVIVLIGALAVLVPAVKGIRYRRR